MSNRTKFNESYLNRITAQPGVVESAESILAQGEGAPLAPAAVLIPVAAHQEASNIHPAMRQYAGSRIVRPFSVVLNMNWPRGADQRSVEDSIHAVHRAQEDFPETDIRYITKEYEEPRIGEIRADLWDATLLALAMSDTETDQPCIGFNHDIKQVKVPRDYIALMQKFAENHHDLPFFGNYAHAPNNDFPNISKAVMWQNFTCRANSFRYEPSTIMPMEWYADEEGFDRSAKFREVHSLLERHDTPRDRFVRSPALLASSRRHVAHLRKGSYSTLWDPKAFHTDESHRSPDAPKDLTEEELFGVVKDSIDTQVYFREVVRKAAASNTLSNRLATAGLILNRVIHLPDADALVEEAVQRVLDPKTDDNPLKIDINQPAISLRPKSGGSEVNISLDGKRYFNTQADF